MDFYIFAFERKSEPSDISHALPFNPIREFSHTHRILFAEWPDHCSHKKSLSGSNWSSLFRMYLFDTQPHISGSILFSYPSMCPSVHLFVFPSLNLLIHTSYMYLFENVFIHRSVSNFAYPFFSE